MSPIQNITVPRKIFAFVRDADNHLVEGAVINWFVNNKHFGKISQSDGRGMLTIKITEAVVKVVVDYDTYHDERVLASTENQCNIMFRDLHIHPDTWKKAMGKHFSAIVGISFIILTIILAFCFSSPSSLQIHIMLATFSLGGGAFGTEISGMIRADIKLGTQLLVGATGAAAIFVILYFAVPAS